MFLRGYVRSYLKPSQHSEWQILTGLRNVYTANIVIFLKLERTKKITIQVIRDPETPKQSYGSIFIHYFYFILEIEIQITSKN